jgi:nucleoside-diphosphate-sugar epimerase
MIIGRGLIANAFANSNIRHNDLVVFASGVSKSSENRPEEYEKEYELLSGIKTDNKLIYFSSCSVKSNMPNSYNNHKIKIEEYIKSNFNNYLILRLPNVVGITNNKNQLVNYFYEALINRVEVTINTDCIRHLIDAEDIPKIVEVFNAIGLNKHTINVAFDNGVSLEKILEIIEDLAGLKYKKVIKYEGGMDYIVETAEIKKYITNKNSYNTVPENIINKYYKKYES